MAELLSQGKEESARIRVENIVREDIYVELLEILELYCELLLARIGLLERKECDSGLEEAVKTIIYAAPHTDIKELMIIREILVHKYGIDFTQSAMDNKDGVIPVKVLKRTTVEAPSAELVILYLREIAKAYDVRFSGLSDTEEVIRNFNSDSNSDQGDEGGAGYPIVVEEYVDEGIVNRGNTTESKLSASNLPDPDGVKKTPISIRLPSKSTDNLHPTMKIPVEIRKNIKKKQASDTASKNGRGDTSSFRKSDDFDALKKRFDALRR